MCVSIPLGYSNRTFHLGIPLCPLGPVCVRSLSNWILNGCKTILHESWTSEASGKSTIRGTSLASRVVCGWPQRSSKMRP